MQHFRRSSKSSTKESSRDKKKEKDREKEEKKKESEKPKHTRTKTAPDFPSLLRLPSSTSTVSASSKSRRATNPSTPTAATTASSATSPSYFSPQAGASLNEVRSPGTRRPPASFSGHGIDTSRGPPITLITRGNSDIARRTSQKAPTDYAHAQQQLLQSGLVSPSGSQSSSARGGRGEDPRHEKVESTPQHRQQQQTNTPSTTRRSSTSTARPAPPKQQYLAQPQQAQVEMASSVDDDDSSEYDSDSPSQNEEPPRVTRPAPSRSNTKPKDSSESEQNEDLFLNIAADSAAKDRATEAASRHDKLRSRIGRINRQSSPLPLQSPIQTQSSSATPTSSRTTEVRAAATQHRRVSHQPTSSRTLPDRTPLTPHTPIERPPSRVPDLSSKKSFQRNDSQLSPQDFLAQFNYTRRPSQPEVQYTPPARAGTYRPSNLGHYSTPREDRRAPEPEVQQNENGSRADGTESHGSTGPAASVWDELDELKSRIRRIEMTGGKIPPTSGQVVSQATTERPRTANTSATTVSSSPNQQRKKSVTSPPESTIASSTPSRTHPLLREALSKAKHHTTPGVYRFLEATASEALTLAEMTGSAGPQGTLHSASSILGGASSADRQVRRKADNICRSLTELCIAMCDTKVSLASPALRTANTITRRPSVQIQPDSPGIRESIEPESNTLNNSPSRALSRIEARKSTLMNGGQREASYEPYDADRHTSSRLSRAGTSLHRNRQSVDEDEEEPTLRAPSRAMTDFRAIRANTERSKLSGRQYTSREPLPDFQQAPTLQTSASLRRPTVSGMRNEQSLLFRDRGQFEPYRESSPAIERQTAGTVRARAQLAASRNPNNRNSIGGLNELQIGRTVSMGRRARGNSTGE